MFAGAAMAVACRSKRGVPFPGYAFVANNEARTVAVVDLAAFAVKKQIRLEDAPTALASHPTRPFVYVLTPASGVLHEIDAASLAVSRRVQTGNPAVTMRLAPANDDAAWVLGSDRRLIRVDLRDMQVAGHVGLPEDATDFDLSTYNKLAGVAYGQAGAAGLVDLTAGKVGNLIHISDGVGAVRFRPDGRMLIVADTAGRTLALVDAPGGRLVSRLPLAVRPDYLCFNQDGGQLFVTGEGRDAVAVIYPYYVPEVAETVLAGRAPGAMSASKNFLFLASPTAGDVSIFDLATHKTIAVATVGAEPSYIAITPDDEYALVLNQKSGDIAVIRIGLITSARAAKEKAASIFTMIPVGSKPVAAVIRRNQAE
jgi:DNA-binding beta-propeller fold protein YncE